MMLEILRKYPGLIFVDQVFTRKFALPPTGAGYDGATLYLGDIVFLPYVGSRS